MKRLLIVNPNTNTTVTGWLAEEARRIAKGAFDVVAINAKSKIAAIQTPEDVEMAARAVVAALSIAPEAGYSAAIIAAFGDPGLEHARALGLMAVAGLGEAGMLAAAQGGRRFSIVTLGAAMREPILARASALGLQKQLVDVHVLPFSIPEMIANRAGRRGEIAAAVRACEGEAALLGGAPFAGMAAEIARLTDRVVLDGVEASIRTFNFE